MKYSRKLLGVIALVLMSSTTSLFAQDNYPDRAIEMTGPYSPGGAADRLARFTARHLAEKLGVPVNVVNRPGGGLFTGTLYFFNQTPDGYNIMFTPPTPYMVNHIENMGAPYKLDDFIYVNAQEVAQSLLMVPKNSELQTFDDIIAGLKEPGKLSAGVIAGSGEHISLLLMMDILGIPASNLRLVTFDGGGPTRTALAGAQIDFGMVAGQGSEVIFDQVRKIAVFAEEKNKDWPDAIPINEALAPYDVEMPLLDSSVRSMVVHRAFAEEYPERYAKFVEAYKEAVESEDFQKEAVEGYFGHEWRGPEASQAIVEKNYNLLVQHSSLLE